ncbi:hypothetical protein [Faecalibacter rhinopitheci]|uniref:Uncharacterized protein n=1 Tax=Faecalibacter rhinopitheci TaxID=2779678 RepID=A0A8J7KIL6_9FLAO|nr:hypothetical protein [Faecalibacter rhinopitheci]MBF0598011.1 hypothetical protein [Faecalibacter rhinopitheci]
MESLLNNYFTIIENLYRIKLFSKNIIQRFLMLMYFPIIISILIYTNTGMLTYIVIFCVAIFSPILFLPAIYNKIFFFYRNFNIYISKYQYEYCEIFNPIVIKYEPTSGKYYGKIFELKTFDNNLIYYNAKKYKTIKKTEELKRFYLNEANKYFDILDYKYQYFEELIFRNKTLNFCQRICLNSDLTLIEIKNLLIELKKITKISQSELSKLFYIITNSNKYKNLIMNNLNSAHSQSNRV